MKLIKVAKWVKYTLTFSLFIAVALVIIGLYYLPEEKVLRLFIAQSELLLERKVQIEDFRYTFNGFRLNGVRIIEKDGKTSYVQAGAIEIKFNRTALLQRKIDISSFTIHEPIIKLDYTSEYSLEPIIRSISANLEKFPLFIEGGKIPEIDINSLTLEVENTPDDLAPLRGTYDISTIVDVLEDHIEFRKVRLKMPETRGAFSSDKLILKIYPEDFALYGEAELHKCDLRWVYMFGKDVNLPYRIVSCRIQDLRVTGKYTEGIVEDANCSLSNGNTVLVRQGYTRVTYTPRILLLKNITATAKGKEGTKTDIQVGFIEVNIQNPHFTFNVGPVEGYIGDFLTMIPVFDKLPVRGKINGSLSFNGSTYTGDLDLEKFAFGTTLTDATLKYSIRENHFQINGMKAVFFGEPAVITAKTLNSRLSSFAVNIMYDSYSFREELQNNEIVLPSGISIQGTVSAAHVHYKEQNAGNITLSYILTGSSLTIPRARCRFLGADVDGEAKINLSGDNPETEVFIRFFSLPAQNLGNYHEAVKDRLYGNASGQLRAKFYPGKEIPPVGTLNFTITNGKVVNTGFQNQLGFLLSPLRYKLEDIEFSHIYGNMLFDSSGYHFSSFVFDAPEVKLRLNGTINRKMVGNLDITLQFTEAFLRNIPNFVYAAPQLYRHRHEGIYTYEMAIEDRNIFEKNSVRIVR